MRTRYVPTVEAYNAWAEVYDSDGNMLQAVDDHELGQGGLMQQFATEVQKANPPSMTLEGRKRLDLVDFGCGTGRNTVTLLQQDWPSDVGVDVAGIDASIGMLRVADNKVAAALSDLGPARGFERTFRLVQHDFLDPIDPKRPPILLPRVHDVKDVYSIAPTGSFIAPTGSFAAPAGGFHGLITTLVLEHFPLQAFFTVLASLVKAGGIALVTNMHADMGSQSQAGFVTRDEEGEAIKMRGTSWAHGTGETIDAAISAGFEVVGEIRETAISEDMVKGGVVGVRGRKWIGVNVWYGMLLKKTS
jgi:SAM-dependent methyltransferase